MSERREPLVKFLLDRFDEDERWIRDEASREDCLDPDRVLADIRAKRLIVDDYLGAVRNQDDAAVSNLGWALLRLAMPYASHPDFREQWRP